MQSENTEKPPPTTDSDAKSDTSFDPLFDGDDGDDSNLLESEPSKHEAMLLESKIAMPGQQNFAQHAPTSASRSTTAVAPPKSAPPLLDPSNYATFSPDLLLTASIDGQVILWDRRANPPGKGVGRLWLNEKTPPWCLSVKSFLITFSGLQETHMHFHNRHVGPQTAVRFMPAGVMGQLTSGMYDS
jgi:transcriptional activator SPT8